MQRVFAVLLWTAKPPRPMQITRVARFFQIHGILRLPAGGRPAPVQHLIISSIDRSWNTHLLPKREHPSFTAHKSVSTVMLDD